MTQPLDGLTEALVNQFEYHQKEYAACGSHSSMASLIHLVFENHATFAEALRVAYNHRQEMAKMIAEREEG